MVVQQAPLEGHTEAGSFHSQGLHRAGVELHIRKAAAAVAVAAAAGRKAEELPVVDRGIAVDTVEQAS